MLKYRTFWYLFKKYVALPTQSAIGQALRLRSEVAAQRAAAQKQRAALDRQVYNLSKKGI